MVFDSEIGSYVAIYSRMSRNSLRYYLTFLDQAPYS